MEALVLSHSNTYNLITWLHLTARKAAYTHKVCAQEVEENMNFSEYIIIPAR